ncbi:MAG: alpha/beta hydrolase [Bacteroidales bacterium]|nr:alpha/beta hydrolase [Candidatus Hennigimonas equi]
MHRTVRITLLTIIVLLVAASFVGSYALVDTALSANHSGRDTEIMKGKWERHAPGLMQWYDSLHIAGVFRDTLITAPDGVALHAVYAAAPGVASGPGTDCASGTAVLVHGYHGCHLSMMQVARMYRDSLKFNVLIPDNRFHGLSGGDHVQMGWFDRLDVKLWLPVSHDIFGDDFTVVHGISMGGATAMMLSGEPDLPPYVRAFVDDCGYSDVWEQFKFNLKQKYHLPVFPLLPIGSIICKIRYGWGFREASSVDQLRKSTAPVLFIHGHEDDFVPTDNVYRCYYAKTEGLRDVWLTPSTLHGRSSTDNPAMYTARLRSFLGMARRLSELNP